MPLGYAVSVTWGDEVICVGGGNAQAHYTNVFSLRWHQGSVERRSLPALPAPAAFWGGALVENTVYVAGGLRAPDDSAAIKNGSTPVLVGTLTCGRFRGIDLGLRGESKWR